MLYVAFPVRAQSLKNQDIETNQNVSSQSAAQAMQKFHHSH
jgi:hypothetical protein